MPMIETAGARLTYTKHGSGPPILLIQGVGLVGAGWTPQVRGLSEHFTVITFDNRGIGQSQMLDRNLSIAAMAADALAILDAEKIDSCHVGGHSMGGMIALQVALNAPGRVKSLALLCTFAQGKQAIRLSPRMFWLGLRSRIGTRRSRRHAFLRIILPEAELQKADKDRLAEELRPLFGHDLAEQPPIVMKQLKALAQYDPRPNLQRLGHIPSLVVSATEDIIARPVYGQELASGIPGSRYVEIPGAGHGLPIQCAEQTNLLLVGQFLGCK